MYREVLLGVLLSVRVVVFQEQQQWHREPARCSAIPGALLHSTSGGSYVSEVYGVLRTIRRCRVYSM